MVTGTPGAVPPRRVRSHRRCVCAHRHAPGRTRPSAGCSWPHREVGVLQRTVHIGIGNAEGSQLGRVRLHQELLDIAAQRVHIGHACCGAQLGPDDPVLHRAQVRELGDAILEPLAFVGEEAAITLPARFAVLGGGALAFGMLELHAVVEHLAQAGGHRPHARLSAIGQAGPRLSQALGHLLPHEIQIGIFLEDGRDLTEAIAGKDRVRSTPLRPANAVSMG